MTTFTRTTVFALLTSLSFVCLEARPAAASRPEALLVAPEPDFDVPRFGFASFNIRGVGERVTYVRWGGIASRMGLEPGDTILSVNGFPLTYHGSWNDGLYRAMARGGLVRLRVRDVRTGAIARREIYLGGGGGVGPITPKIHVGHYHSPASSYGHHDVHYNSNVEMVKEIAKLFD
jgi:PDZ domain